jgi:predicted ATP-grasp superfamily ATP-dependent carboligase
MDVSARADAGGGWTPRIASELLLVKKGPRVLLTDADNRSVLAACRGLAKAGYRVSTVSDTRFASGHWSRFSESRITLAGPEADPEGYVERLSEVLRRGEYDLVMPGSELSLLPISKRRELIEPYARLGLPSHERVLLALDKRLLQRQAVAAGLAPPRSVVCSSLKEALANARNFAFPLVVKPAHSVEWAADGLRQRRGQVVRDPSLFEAAVAQSGVPLILQEYVLESAIVSCAGVRVDGRLLGLTLARYERTYPLQVGSAAMAVTMAPPRWLIEHVEDLLESIGWCGIFELELLELGENRFGAIDLNPRPFGWMALAVGAGANLPALWCDHLLGRPSVYSDGARVGIRYRCEDRDVLNALAQLRWGRVRCVATVLRPHRGVVHAFFRIDDPAPLGARMLSGTIGTIKRVFHNRYVGD